MKPEFFSTVEGMTRTLTPLAVLIAASLTLAGCSVAAPPAPGPDGPDGGTEETAPEFSADPASGELIEGTGYSYNVPDGWGVPPGATDPQLDTVAADLTDDDGFSDNINVLLSPAGALTPDQVETAGVAELEQFGATEVEVRDRVSIEGAESAHLSARFESQGVQYRVEQYYPTQGDQTFVVTFSFSDDLPEADRLAVSESILASWSWV